MSIWSQRPANIYHLNISFSDFTPDFFPVIYSTSQKRKCIQIDFKNIGAVLQMQTMCK